MKITPVKLSVTNCFVVGAEDDYVLIDTGFEDDWDVFRTRLKEADVELPQISHIILTHHHDDHCGLLHNLLRENDSIRVVMSHLCKDLVLTGENDLTHGAFYVNRPIALIFRLFRSLILRNTSDTFPPYRLRERDILITQDTDLHEIGIPLNGKIIATPGHSIDSISVLFADGNCLVGDAASNVFQFAGAKYCVVMIGDLDAFYRSWEKITAAGASRILPAHGAPFAADKLKENLWKNKAENLVPFP